MSIESGAPVRPGLGLTPEQVVTTQLAGLARQAPDDPDTGPASGLAAAWQLASPANKAATGPLPRFAAMLRNPLYGVLLGHRAAQLGPLECSGEAAAQEVVLLGADGSTAGFTWYLSRQRGGAHDGCWMTDGVGRH